MSFCQSGWTARSGPKGPQREGLWIFKMSKISLQQNSIFIKLWKFTSFFFKNLRFFSVFTYKEKMFTIEIKSRVIFKNNFFTSNFWFPDFLSKIKLLRHRGSWIQSILPNWESRVIIQGVPINMGIEKRPEYRL